MAIKQFTPEVFKSPSIQKLGVVYAETRRDPSKPLELLDGNLSVQEYAGAIPLVLTEKNRQRTGSELPLEAWTALIDEEVRKLDTDLKRQLGLTAIAYPAPVHKSDLLNLNTDLSKATISVPFAARPEADISLVEQPGVASAFAPADCQITSIVDTSTGRLVQVHSGYVGLDNKILEKAVATTGINPRQSVAYVSPHAQAGYVVNQVNNGLVDRFSQSEQLRDHLLYKPDGVVELDMKGALKAQLEEAGFRDDHVEFSPNNTLSDATLYSQSNFLTKGVNGRFGVILGKRQ